MIISDYCGIFPFLREDWTHFIQFFFFFLKYVLLTNERRRVQLRCKVPHPGAGPPECLVQVMSSPQQRSACLLWLDSDFNRGRGLFWLQPQISANHLFFFSPSFQFEISADKCSVLESGGVTAGDATISLHLLIKIWCGSTLAGWNPIR